MHPLDPRAAPPDRIGLGSGRADRPASTIGIGKPPEPAPLSGPNFKTSTQMSSHGYRPQVRKCLKRREPRSSLAVKPISNPAPANISAVLTCAAADMELPTPVPSAR